MAYSPNAKLAVLKMHENGMSLREIEREFGIDRKDIKDWMYRYQTEGFEGLVNHKYTQTDYATRCDVVREYVEDNRTYRELSIKYGISRKYIYKLVKRFLEGGYEALVEKPRTRKKPDLVL